MTTTGLPDVDDTTQAASKEGSELAIKLSVKQEDDTKQPPVSRLVRRRPRVRDCKRPLPKHLKLSAINVRRYYHRLLNHT